MPRRRKPKRSGLEQFLAIILKGFINAVFSKGRRR